MADDGGVSEYYKRKIFLKEKSRKVNRAKIDHVLITTHTHTHIHEANRTKVYNILLVHQFTYINLHQHQHTHTYMPFWSTTKSATTLLSIECILLRALPSSSLHHMICSWVYIFVYTFGIHIGLVSLLPSAMLRLIVLYLFPNNIMFILYTHIYLLKCFPPHNCTQPEKQFYNDNQIPQKKLNTNLHTHTCTQ